MSYHDSGKWKIGGLIFGRRDEDPKARAKKLLAESIALERNGEVTEAYRKCDEAVKLAPFLAEAYYRRAWVALILPDYKNYLDQVIQDCSKVIEREPYHAGAYNERGRAYDRRGDTFKAVKDYSSALIYDPTMTITVLNLMSIQLRARMYPEVVASYDIWEKRLDHPVYELIASMLSCSALALDGKPYSSNMEPLLDDRIRIPPRAAWNNDRIMAFIGELKREGVNVTEAEKVQRLFMEHY